METPRIQYTKSADGTRIACYRMGAGPALIDLDPMPTHLLAAWESESERADCLSWARHFTLIKFDVRGSGLSQRGNVRHSLEAYSDDFLAVLDLFKVERASIVAPGQSAMQAVAFAAWHPERVERLVLFSGFVSPQQLGSSPKAMGLVSLLEHDYEMYTETAALSMYGWSEKLAREQAAIIRAGQTREEAIAMWSELVKMDARDLLPLVKAQTLVVHVRGSEIVPASVAADIVATIPGAQLMLLEGDVPAGDIRDEEQNRAIRAFLLDEEPPSADVGGAATANAVATTEIILFVDVVSSTALTERLGDAGFRQRSRALESSIREELRAAGGKAVEGKVMGDGVMATFSSARQAITAALACREASARHELPLHVGIHAGDVIREGSNVFGGAVNMAARVCEASEAGEILVSDVVRALARTSTAGVTFEDRGERTLKGIDEPQRLWAVSAAS